MDPFEAALEEAEPHQLLREAVQAARENDWEEVGALAGGPAFGACWTALAVGLCSLHDRSYEEGVTWAISLGRDTDTNAVVAGALLGCRDSASSIPARWLGAAQGEGEDRAPRGGAGAGRRGLSRWSSYPAHRRKRCGQLPAHRERLGD